MLDHLSLYGLSEEDQEFAGDAIEEDASEEDRTLTVFLAHMEEADKPTQDLFTHLFLDRYNGK